MNFPARSTSLRSRLSPGFRCASSGPVTPSTSLTIIAVRANGSRECAPDDRLREAIHVAASGGVDCFVACAPRDDAGATQRIDPHSRGAMRPRHDKNFRPWRAWGMPGADAPAASRANDGKHTSQSPQVHRKHPAFPHAMVGTVSFALSPVTNSFCHRHPRIWLVQARSGRRASADLASATDARTTRLRRTRMHRSSCAPSHRSRVLKKTRPAITCAPDAAASTASRTTFVTIAIRPSLGRDGGRYRRDLGER
jgi:hypothetical protein